MTRPLEPRYQVFVSSTFRDLEQERSKVLQAVLELRAFPAGMELFPSADDEQFEFIKREIGSSDYFVVIVGGLYGSVASDNTSFTEKEYDHAVELKKPILGFLCRDLDALPGRLLEKDPDRRARIESFRSKVERSRLVRYYGNPDELKSQVLQALTHAFRMNPQRGWVPTSETSREEDLREINHLLKRTHELEGELRELRATNAGREKFAQGEDLVQVDGLDPKLVAEHGITWDRLLVVCFGEWFPEVRGDTVHGSLYTLMKSMLQPDEYAATGSELVDRTYVAATRQFSTLGLISIRDVKIGFPHQTERSWVLTDAGVVRLGLAIGLPRRSTT